MLALSVLSLAVAVAFSGSSSLVNLDFLCLRARVDAALFINKRQTDGFTIPESCESVCTVLGQVTVGTINGDFTSICSDTISSQLSTCLACAINAGPSAFTDDVHDGIQVGRRRT